MSRESLMYMHFSGSWITRTLHHAFFHPYSLEQPYDSSLAEVSENRWLLMRCPKVRIGPSHRLSHRWSDPLFS